MTFEHIQVPTEGKPITVNSDLTINVPDCPIIPFIEGDGIGVDVTPAMILAVDAAVKKAYGSSKKIAWMEIFAGEKATHVYGENWRPSSNLLSRLKAR